MAKKYVYFFGAGAAEGNMKMKDILGGKGANLAEMAGIGLPVPPGFTISTEVCALYYKNRERIPEAVRLEVEKNLKKLEKAVGQAFGDPKNPLLVSVRSGARASMPGMMDTILNLGLNDKTAAGPGREDRQRALRLRLLPPLRPDVRRRRPRPQARPQGRHRSLRSDHRSARSTSSASRATPTSPPTTSRTSSPASRRPSRRRPARISPTTPGSSSGARSAPSSARG